MPEGPLSRGQVALVDQDDLAAVSRFTWSALPRRDGSFYAIRTDRSGGRKRTVYMHVEIMQPPPGHQVDHRDGHSLDNRRSNLRIATPSQNGMNSRGRVRTNSRYKGVHPVPSSRRPWRAAIRVKGRLIHIGRFSSECDAAAAYDAAARLHFGEFARLNFCQP